MRVKFFPFALDLLELPISLEQRQTPPIQLLSQNTNKAEVNKRGDDMMIGNPCTGLHWWIQVD